MPRGGRRQGAPGVSYPQRTDLTASASALPATAVPGQPYGQAGAQLAAQRAVPMAAAPAAPAAPMLAPASPPAPSLPAVQPGQLGPIDRPTERPTEPGTAGLMAGPGPGPEALGLGQSPQTVGDLLSRIGSYSPEVAALLAKTQQGNL